MNANLNIGAILSKAWKITWKYKVLWIFGILAGCTEGSRSNFSNSNTSGSGRDFGNGQLPEPFRQFLRTNWQEAITSLINQYLVAIVIVCSLLCVLTIVFYFLGTMGKIGLIKGTQKAELGAERLGFGEIWGESLRYFWRMFGLSLLIAIPILIVVAILIVVFLAALAGMAGDNASGARAAGSLFALLGVFIPGICCLAIVAIVLNMIIEQAKNAIVIDDLGVIAGLKRGWNVFRRNFLSILFISIILGVISVIVSIIIALPLVLVLLPSIVSYAALQSGGASGNAATLAPLAFAGICFLVYLPILLLLNGIRQTYLQSSLTLTYLSLTAPAAEPPAEPINAQ